MIARFVPEIPPPECAAAEVEAAAATAVGRVLVVFDDVDVADVEDEEVVVVLDELVVEEAVLEASEAKIDVTSV